MCNLLHTYMYYYIVFIRLMYNILYKPYIHTLLGQLDVSHRGLLNTYHRRHCIGQYIVYSIYIYIFIHNYIDILFHAIYLFALCIKRVFIIIRV